MLTVLWSSKDHIHIQHDQIALGGFSRKMTLKIVFFSAIIFGPCMADQNVYLASGYDKTKIPLRPNESLPKKIISFISLKSIQEVNDAASTATLSMYMQFLWDDPNVIMNITETE